MESDLKTRFNIKHAIQTVGVNPTFELVQNTTNFTSEALRSIYSVNVSQCQYSGNQKNNSFPGQPEKVYNALTCPKKHILFTVEKDAEEQCHRSAQRIKAWKYNNNRYGYQAFKFFFPSIVQMIYHEYYL